MEEKETRETTVPEQTGDKRRKPFVPTWRYVRRVVDPTLFFKEYDKRRKREKG